MTTRSPKFKPDDLVRVRTHPEVFLVVVEYDDRPFAQERALVRCVTYNPQAPKGAFVEALTSNPWDRDDCQVRLLPECLLERAAPDLTEGFVQRSQRQPDPVRVHITGYEHTDRDVLRALCDGAKRLAPVMGRGEAPKEVTVTMTLEDGDYTGTLTPTSPKIPEQEPQEQPDSDPWLSAIRRSRGDVK